MEVTNNLSSNDRDKLNLYNETFSVVGIFDGVYENCEIEMSGNLKVHPQYGSQIDLEGLRVIRDNSSKESIIDFLTQSEIKGIRLQNAIKIYDAFGKDSIDTVIYHPEKLLQINGIGQVTFEKVLTSVDQYKKNSHIHEFCSDVGIGYKLTSKLIMEFGENTIDIIKNDPYSILENSEIFTFKQVDELAEKMGRSFDDPKRLKAGFIYVLHNLLDLEGSTGTPFSNMIKAFNREIGLDSDNYFYCAMNALEINGDIIVDSNIIYSSYYFNSEKFISKVIAYMVLNNKGCFCDFSKNVINDAINSFPFELNNQQKEAIESCCKNKFNIITGPPGCGKSTILKALVDIFEKSECPVILLSPTGKATRRMKECTNHDASTIHKFLKVKKSLKDAVRVNVDKNTVIIVDESSMMDIILFSKLLNCLKNSTRVILVGDNDQLPSVQAGNVLGDLIKVLDEENVHTLTDIMRQSENSNIIKYCSYVNSGKTFDECYFSDLEYKVFDNEQDLVDELVDKYCSEVSNRNVMDVQVLAPYKKGILGINNLNKVLNDAVNYNKVDEDFGYKLGDKVIQLTNNYKQNVFNGETGIVSKIDDDYMYVNFDNASVAYSTTELGQITLANATTVHKSQGSEYPVVFVVIGGPSDFLLIRKIIYTAISRGKKKVYLYSMNSLVDKCIHNNYYKERITKLGELIVEEATCQPS